MPEASSEADRIRSYYRDASWTASPGRQFLVAEWRAQIAREISELGLDFSALRVCDVGCGTGSDLQRWTELGVPEAQLSGTELIRQRAEAARGALPGATIEHVNGFEVPFPENGFDVVTASLVFSTVVASDGRRRLAAEMRRVADKGGVIAIYDFRISKPWNPNVRPVRDRDLTSVLGPPWRRLKVGPFLPVLDLALRLPASTAQPIVRMLPRTHRIWMWRS